MSSFPASLDNFTSLVDTVDDMEAVNVNELQDAIEAIETELGTDPAGTATDVKTRLARLMDGPGNLSLKAATTLTISGGIITATQNYHRVDTQSSAATDDLDTITAAAAEGFVLRLRANNTARTVVIKHGTGNISCPGGQDITLDTNGVIVDLVYDDDIDLWIVVGATPGALLAADNVFTGANYFYGGVSHKGSSVNTSLTLDDSYSRVLVDASGASRIMTLPDAATVLDLEFTVVKVDSSANTVTLYIDGSQLINGATTLVLSAQWAKTTVHSNGTQWVVIA
jgi:hypothetical protein